MHFPHPGARIRLFEQNTDIINFGLFLFNGTQNCKMFNVVKEIIHREVAFVQRVKKL